MADQDFSGNSNYELQATISRTDTTISVTTIRVRRKTGTGYWTNSGYPWSVEIGSSDWSGSWTYDFTGGTTYQTVTSNRSATKGAGTTQTVRVQVSMGGGIGSATITQSVTIPTTPSAPGTPTVGAVATSQFNVSWNAPSNGGSAITGYDIQVNTSASATGATTYSQGTSTSRTITGRSAATDYYVRVRAKNALGDGAWSNWRATTTLPVAPSTPVVTVLSFGTLAVQWTKGANGAAVDQYQLQYQPDGGLPSSLTGPTTSRTISTGLIPGQRYTFLVRAQSAAGWGPWSAQTVKSTLPAAPSSPALSSPSLNSLLFSYTRGSNGTGILEYQIQYNTAASESGATTVSNGTSLSRTLSSLSPGTAYYARARARSESGWGAWSTWAGPVSTLPSSPPGLTISPDASGTSARVALSSPSGTVGVTKYRVEYRRGAGGTVTSFDTTSTSATRTGLLPGNAYQWRASAFFGSYQTPWTTWASVIQPNPSWTPGDYLAGSLAAGLDVTYAWTGTANASTSTATGKGVTGWQAAAPATLHRITGGLFGTYAARLLIRTDPALSDVPYVWVFQTIDINSGGQYIPSAYVRPMRGQAMRIRQTWRDASNNTIGEVISAATFCPGGEWTRIVGDLGTAPAGAVASRIVVEDDPTSTDWSPWVPGEYYDVDGVMVTLGSLYPYFDGSFPSTTEYAYAWTGVAHSSESTRTTLAQSGVDPLQDPDCPPIPLPPLPPVIDADCVDEVGVWRRYWTILPASEVPRWLAIVPTFRLVTTDAVGQVRIRVYENPDNLSPIDIGVNDYISEQLVTFIPGNTEMVIDGVSERMRASVAGGPWLDADHLLQGTDGGPATWPELSCGQGYVISYDVPLEQPDGNMTPSVQLTGRY